MVKDRKAHERQADKEVAEFLKGYLARNPETAHLGASAKVRFYKKRPPGFARVPIQVVDALIASRDYRARTNKQIVAGIQARFPNFQVEEGYLDRPLPSYVVPEIRRMLGGNGTPLDLKTYNTLSKIKRGLRGNALRSQGASAVTVTITFAEDAVVVGDRAYKVVKDGNGYSRITVGKDKLRVDVLKALLEKPS